jgi:hypothetical protein
VPLDIKPIETRYAGCRFRSRLEARWAVVFDHLGLRWEYEPEGYVLPSGTYLPDFRLHLPAGAVWLEIKPMGAGDDARWIDLATMSGLDVYVAFGLPRPPQRQPPPVEGRIEVYRSNGSWDDDQRLTECAACDRIGFAYEGRWAKLPCGCIRAPFDDIALQSYRMADAFTAGRSARFEHRRRG